MTRIEVDGNTLEVDGRIVRVNGIRIDIDAIKQARVMAKRNLALEQRLDGLERELEKVCVQRSVLKRRSAELAKLAEQVVYDATAKERNIDKLYNDSTALCNWVNCLP